MCVSMYLNGSADRKMNQTDDDEVGLYPTGTCNVNNNTKHTTTYFVLKLKRRTYIDFIDCILFNHPKLVVYHSTIMNHIT